MTISRDEIKRIHERALALSGSYKKCEVELLEIILQVRDHKIYRHFECTSVFEYCVKILKLDPGVVYGFTAVAKKIKDVPELKEQIKTGALNVSTAKRITSVLTKENKRDWFEKAASLPVKRLEREVARANPKTEVKERASYLTSRRVRLELGLDENLMLKLRRIQDLESQKQRKSVDLEETLAAMANSYLSKNDPKEKAKRAVIRGITQCKDIPSTWRECERAQGHRKSENRGPEHRKPIPAPILHQVHLRDQGRCQYLNSHTMKKCEKQRFIEIHHQTPIHLGGQHELENLVTLCSEHHKWIHSHQAATSSPNTRQSPRGPHRLGE